MEIRTKKVYAVEATFDEMLLILAACEEWKKSHTSGYNGDNAREVDEYNEMVCIVDTLKTAMDDQ